VTKARLNIEKIVKDSSISQVRSVERRHNSTMNAHEDTDDDAPEFVNKENFMHLQLQYINALILKLDSSFIIDGSFKVRSGHAARKSATIQT